MAVHPRISARRGNEVELVTTFSKGGIPTDPYAIVKVDIYRGQALPHNIVATFLFPRPCDIGYPAPAEKVMETIPPGQCGTGPQAEAEVPGKFRLLWQVPSDLPVPDVYIDVWSFISTNPCLLPEFVAGCVSDGCYPDLLDPALADLTLTACGRFWVYPDDWNMTDGLETVRLGFEPLDQRFRRGENRPLEVGMTPLPLYDFNFNLIAPILPFVKATILISTNSNEVIVDDEPMEIGLRQGSFRTNPFVLKYNLDTSRFLVGTYKYRVLVALPDGSKRASGDFILTVS